MRVCTLAAISVVALAAAPLLAQTGAEPERGASADSAKKSAGSVDEILAEHGLGGDQECLEFPEGKHLLGRQRRWLGAIRQLSETHPGALYGWLLGAESPPSAARAEALRQRNCMLDGLVDDSIDRSELFVDINLDGGSQEPRAEQRRLAKSYLEDSARRRAMRNRWTKSHYRSALSQARIWRRKFLFFGDAFNEISEEAARRCRLDAGAPWRPNHERHEYCWEEVLTASDKVREILSASSAPGLSRHHWGTEFDLFSLSPRSFEKPAKRHDEYQWMQRNALGFGFFQSYRNHTGTYMEERWHWSYYPIAQALTRFASNHREEVERRLHALWDGFARRFNRGRASRALFFAHIRKNWAPYMLDVFVPTFERRARKPTPSDG